MPGPSSYYLKSEKELEALGIHMNKLRSNSNANGPVDPVTVSNCVFLSLVHRKTSIGELRKWLIELLGADDSTFASEQAIWNSISRVKREYASRNKAKSSSAVEYLKAQYKSPSGTSAVAEVSGDNRKRQEAEWLAVEEDRHAALFQTMRAEQAKGRLEETVVIGEESDKNLQSNIQQLRAKYVIKAHQYSRPLRNLARIEVSGKIRKRKEAEMLAAPAEEDMYTAQFQHELPEQAERRLDAVVDFIASPRNPLPRSEQFQNKLQERKGKLKIAQAGRDSFHSQLFHSSKLEDKEHARKEQAQAKLQNAKMLQREDQFKKQEEKLKNCKRTIAKLEEEVRQRDLMICQLNEQCLEVRSKVISAKEGKAFSPKVRLMCMQLIDKKVPVANIPSVISAVLSVADLKLSELPSERSIRRILRIENDKEMPLLNPEAISLLSDNLMGQSDETTMATAVLMEMDDGEILVDGGDT